MSAGDFYPNLRPNPFTCKPSLMEEYTYTPEAPALTSAACANCDNPQVEHGFATPLCTECREALIKYPIPRWLWLFAAGIALLLVYNIVKLPRFLNAARHLTLAEQGVHDRNYHTAYKEAGLVLQDFPEHIEAHSYRLIAAAYNIDQHAFAKEAIYLLDKPVTDENLFAKVNTAVDYLSSIASTDSLLLQKLPLTTTLPLKEQIRFFDSVAVNDGSVANISYCGVYIAGSLMDAEELPQARRILEKSLDVSPGHYAATMSYISTLRQMGDLEKANKMCDEILERNHEDAYAMSAKARVEMRLKHMDIAEDLALEAIRLDPMSDHALASQALILHTKGKKAESRQLLSAVSQMGALNGDSSTAVHLRKVLDGVIVYR